MQIPCIIVTKQAIIQKKTIELPTDAKFKLLRKF